MLKNNLSEAYYEIVKHPVELQQGLKPTACCSERCPAPGAMYQTAKLLYMMNIYRNKLDVGGMSIGRELQHENTEL